MTLAIFTLVQHLESQGKYYGYAPYMREMDIWNSHFDGIIVVAPLSAIDDIDEITAPYAHPNVNLVKIPVFNVKSITGIFRLLLNLPSIVYKMFRVMRKADHLHFRSPSNISAIAALIQVFFPKKKKSMRYAGNWDPRSSQPIGYRFQKKIFSSPIWSKNMTALVYGEWKNKTKNIRSFFAATFSEDEKEEYSYRDYSKILKFTFIGALVPGKQPLKAIKIIEGLNNRGLKCQLEIFGDGELKPQIENYIEINSLSDIVYLNGNVSKEVIKQRLKQSHFNILPSKSEGWPKSIAEGMFYGVIPIATKISCVPWMLKFGERGILINDNIDDAVQEIYTAISSKDLNTMAGKALSWSQEYTVERQEEEIKDILSI
ncbi:glycosyltransferase [Winogradskyella vincentii]|uniref:Glycosyltransferase n=1 Tax=Winogradskyella vincentii TaxID=2877122 RepID=A0ABS7Y198_9FLAO|nr:glycosyltransferase [Winogradskyella vincentii]MCA0153708.1 glycosyltransferase [Winogradskyella vincentii]